MDKQFRDAFYIGYCFALRKVGYAIDKVREKQSAVMKDYELFITMDEIFGEERKRKGD